MHPLTVSVAEILGHPGEYREFSVSSALEGVATALARLEDSPVDAELRAESVVEGVLVTGTVRGASVVECSRCLKEVGSTVEVEVCELFATPGHEPPPEEDFYPVSGTEIALEPMLRDALVLALPLHPLCSAACRGYCAGCGSDLNVDACVCSREETDPRWAPLETLRARLEG